MQQLSKVSVIRSAVGISQRLSDDGAREKNGVCAHLFTLLADHDLVSVDRARWRERALDGVG